MDLFCSRQQFIVKSVAVHFADEYSTYFYFFVFLLLAQSMASFKVFFNSTEKAPTRANTEKIGAYHKWVGVDSRKMIMCKYLHWRRSRIFLSTPDAQEN